MRRIDPLYLILPNYCPPQESVLSATDETTDTALAEPSSNDPLHFGRHWPKIEPLESEGILYETIAERRQEIGEKKKSCEAFIDEQKNTSLQPFYDDFEKTLATGTLKPSKSGGGGVYILYDVLGTPRFVVKPEDESILCLNNPKHRGSPFRDTEHRVRDHIPLYHSSSSESATYALAKEVGIDNVVPTTAMAIVRSSIFYDLSSRLEEKEREQFLALCGAADEEKLCSVQAFIPDSLDLNQAMHEWLEAGLDQVAPIPIDQEDFEDVNLLLWLTYDADGHSSNFRLYFKGLDEEGKAYYGLKKIDGGLTFPEKNAYLLNYLGYLPNAKDPISVSLREKIASIKEANLLTILDKHGLHYAKEPLLERIGVLKELALRPEITVEEMNHRLELLGLPEGRELAVSSLSLEELLTKVLKYHDIPSSDTPQKRARPIRMERWEIHLPRRIPRQGP